MCWCLHGQWYWRLRCKPIQCPLVVLSTDYTWISLLQVSQADSFLQVLLLLQVQQLQVSGHRFHDSCGTLLARPISSKCQSPGQSVKQYTIYWQSVVSQKKVTLPTQSPKKMVRKSTAAVARMNVKLIWGILLCESAKWRVIAAADRSPQVVP